MAKKEFDTQFDYIDSGNISHSVKITDKDFDLVQVDKSIHDTKFKSKPTTFFKDALKRFSKNKASVAGAVILGTLLLLSFVIPLADRNNIDDDLSTQQFLPPKLFPSGTGFWDGTVKYEDKVANPNSIGTIKDAPTYGKMLPGSFSSDAGSTNFKEAYILEISEAKEGKTDSPTLYGSGGTLLIKSDKLKDSSPEYIKTHEVKYFSPLTNFDFNSNVYTFDLTYNKEFKLNGYENGKYTITFEYGKSEDSALNENSVILVSETDDSSSINLNETLEQAGLFAKDKFADKKINDAYISINLIASDKEATLLPITKAEFKNKGDIDKDISIEDPCKKLAIKRKEKNAYWTLYSFGNGSKALKDATCHYVSFTYDAYDDLYGMKSDEIIPETTVKQYIKEGKLPEDFIKNKAKYDWSRGSKINLYDEGYTETPIVHLDKVVVSSDSEGNIYYSYNCTVYKYKSAPFNYDKMPIFLFGTDQQGHDLLKIVFVGLRTSLLLGILASSICFIFGLVYGAIEGYFGGTVDLVMQRFTDILSGVPWIVVMTLMILNFGQSFGVFAAALCLTGWIGTAGLTRTQFYRFRGREYILASRTLGARDARLIFRHILPNSMGTIITSSVLMIPSVIFSEATISYLGLGLKGMNSLGVILSDNQKFLQDYPYLLVVPAIVIALIMISFNLFGNGLRDAFNPSLKGSE